MVTDRARRDAGESGGQNWNAPQSSQEGSGFIRSDERAIALGAYFCGNADLFAQALSNPNVDVAEQPPSASASRISRGQAHRISHVSPMIHDVVPNSVSLCTA